MFCGEAIVYVSEISIDKVMCKELWNYMVLLRYAPDMIQVELESILEGAFLKKKKKVMGVGTYVGHWNELMAGCSY
jgi:hypothetical protein